MSIVLQSGINSSKMIGQEYDGASYMTTFHVTVQAIIRQSHPATCCVNCAAHALKLNISKASEVQAIRNGFGIICNVVVGSSPTQAVFYALLSTIKKGFYTLLEHKILDGHIGSKLNIYRSFATQDWKRGKKL
jgi:hypothetical protein